MLIQQPKIRIATREITLKTGERAFAYFAFINIEGAIEVRFLGIKTAPKTSVVPSAILALPEAFRHMPILALKAVVIAYSTPYVSTLVFLKSQLTRAPSFV